jgi:autotransporter translocation and assembly factor TamB
LLTLTLALVLVLATCVSVMTALLGSEAGTRFVAGRVNSLAGDAVQWSRLEGTLLGSLRLHGLRLNLPGLDLSIDELSLTWEPLALLQGRAQVDILTGSGVRLVSSPKAEEPEAGPFNPQDLSLPIAVELGKVGFSDLQFTGEGQEPLQIDSLKLDASFSHRRLELHSLAIRLPEGGMSLNATTVLAANMPVEVAASWDWLLTLPDDSADTGSAAPRTTKLQGNLALGGNLLWGENLGFDVSYQLAAAGLQNLDSALPSQIRTAGDIKGFQAGDELLLQLATLAAADTPLALSLEGQVTDLNAAEPAVSLKLDWQGLTWPLQTDQADIVSAQGSANLDGALSGYTLELAAELAGSSIPSGHWTLAARGDAGQLVLEELSGRVLGGELAVSGELQWQPQPRWNLEISGAGLDPGQLEPQLPGALSVSVQTTGRVDPETGPQVEVLVRDVSGTLKGYPLQADGHASVHGDAVQVISVNLESQGNMLSASGDISPDVLAIKWQLDASNPGGLSEGLDGELSARGTVTGNMETPRLQAQATGKGLRFNTYAAASLRATLTTGLETDNPLELNLGVSEVVDGERKLVESLRLQATGTTGEHRLNASMDTGNEQLRALLIGGLDQSMSTWRGQLAELSLDSADYGGWDLSRPAELSLAPDRAALGESCLRVNAGPGRVCVLGNWAGTGPSEMQSQVQALPLDLFVPAVSGEIDGDLHASLGANGELKVDGAISLGSGEVEVDETRRLAHGGGQLSLRIDSEGLQGTLQFTAPERGELLAVAKLPALRALPLADEQPLTGSLEAELPDLSGIAAWVPQLGHSAGRLTADLQLGGTLADPLVDGKLALGDGAATLPLAGLDLRDIRLEVAGDPSRPDRLALTGSIQSGPGQLLLNGEARPEDNSLAFTLAGDRFEVYDTQDARVMISPDLQLAWQNNTLKLRGQVTIPQAAITPKIRLSPAAQGQTDSQRQVPGEAIAPSPDVVVVSETLDAAPTDEVPEAPFRIDSRLRVQMGDDVRVHAVGFVSSITGAVDFTNTPDQEALIPLANGRFSLQDGTFRAFGQDLEIESGHLIFANVPATEPELNLRAVRWIDNDPQVTAAGVMLTGPLDQPVLELFSRPQLETSEIQSYLLTGQSPRSRDNVLGVGTYVSPKIYVGYGFNMLEKTSEFNSLYNISPRYGLGTSVGEADNNINITITYEH